jgi:hypothetical protein
MAFGCTAFGCTVSASSSVEAEASSSSSSGSESSSSSESARETRSTQLRVGRLEPQAGVDVVETTCDRDRSEKCNGLDDNCNGEIDEGCGYRSGTIQVTLAWDTGADLDLYVTDPKGDMLSFQNDEVASGGRLDHDGRGQCEPDADHNHIENAFWERALPALGTYKIAVHYYGECASGAGPTAATVSVAVGGSVVGTYEHTLSPTQRAPIASFDLSK